MKELIVDTSGDEGLVAVVENGQVLGETRLPGGPTLSKTLGVVVKEIVCAHGTSYDRIVVGVGPGSFTGIRVGVAMAESLSLGWQVPLHTVCSLLGYEGTAVVDARSGGFYVQEPGKPAQLVPMAQAEQVFRVLGQLVSPHPSKISQRLPSIHPTPCFLSPLLLSHFSQPHPSPLIYLDQNTSLPYNENPVLTQGRTCPA